MEIYNHNVFEPWPLEDKSIQAIITSPPYWGKRDYDIPDVRISDTFTGQHGLEPTVNMYIDHAMLWLAEAWRVLKDDGCLFINIADTYGGSWGASNKDGINGGKHDMRVGDRVEGVIQPPQRLFRRKSLLLIPDRLRIAMFEQGWYFRNKAIWFKSNGIPDSVKDRFSCRHEDVIFCTKSPRYFFDLDSVRVPYKPDSFRRFKAGIRPQNIPLEAMPGKATPHRRVYSINPKGANPGDVWQFSAVKAPGMKHYAVYPEKLVERMVKCSTRPGDVVLDPFVGSGTTVLEAEKLGREAIGMDIGYDDVRRDCLGLLCRGEISNE